MTEKSSTAKNSVGSYASEACQQELDLILNGDYKDAFRLHHLPGKLENHPKDYVQAI